MSSVYAPSARLHARIRARSADACVSILHFRAVNDGVDASRRTLDLDASSFALLSFLSFPTLIQLVPTQTRRTRLPVCARKPLGGQVLFTARTLSRLIVSSQVTFQVAVQQRRTRLSKISMFSTHVYFEAGGLQSSSSTPFVSAELGFRQ